MSSTSGSNCVKKEKLKDTLFNETSARPWEKTVFFPWTMESVFLDGSGNASYNAPEIFDLVQSLNVSVRRINHVMRKISVRKWDGNYPACDGTRKDRDTCRLVHELDAVEVALAKAAGQATDALNACGVFENELLGDNNFDACLYSETKRQSRLFPEDDYGNHPCDKGEEEDKGQEEEPDGDVLFTTKAQNQRWLKQELLSTMSRRSRETIYFETLSPLVEQSDESDESSQPQPTTTKHFMLKQIQQLAAGASASSLSSSDSSTLCPRHLQMDGLLELSKMLWCLAPPDGALALVPPPPDGAREKAADVMEPHWNAPQVHGDVCFPVYDNREGYVPGFKLLIQGIDAEIKVAMIISWLRRDSGGDFDTEPCDVFLAPMRNKLRQQFCIMTFGTSDACRKARAATSKWWGQSGWHGPTWELLKVRYFVPPAEKVVAK